MRIFSNVKESVIEIERELFEMGINNHPMTMQDKKVAGDKSFDTKELIGYSYCLTKWDDINEVFDLFNNDLKETGRSYCDVEFKERIGPAQNPGTSFMTREKLWNRFLKDGKFSYTYSERISSQLNFIINELKRNPGSRQCVLTFYDKHDDMLNMGGKERIPCSMYYQFLLRDINGRKVLSLMYTMRSCDYYNHFVIDMYLAIKMLRYVAEKIGAEPGEFIHFMGSLHAYQGDFKYKNIY
jgi:thymidylate synthase